MTMHLIGLAGPAGAGKDTVADLLIGRHGWRKFSFSDALYAEVSDAFGVPVIALKDRATKESPTYALALENCRDTAFVGAILGDVCIQKVREDGFEAAIKRPRSPRWTLQRWGTDYRRAQDPDYWVTRAAETYRRARDRDAPPAGLANTSARFPNEVAWIRAEGGTVVHVTRPGCGPESDYVSERPVPHKPGDYVLANDAGLRTLTEHVNELVAWLDEQAQARRAKA